MREDLNEARKAGKRGIIVFFSQQSCNHCQAFIDTTLSEPATKHRVQKDYVVIGLDIFNDLELTQIDGTVTTIKDYAETSRARLTPTLIFYGIEDVPLVKIIGLYPPEKFNQVLDYIDTGAYQKIKLNQYLRERAASSTAQNQSIEVDTTLFAKPPYDLNRVNNKVTRPLLVVYDSPHCNTCARFHKRVLGDSEVRRLLKNYDAVQLDMSDNNNVPPANGPMRCNSIMIFPSFSLVSRAKRCIAWIRKRARTA